MANEITIALARNEQGHIILKDKEANVAVAKFIAQDYALGEIATEEDYRKAEENFDKLEALAKNLSRRRLAVTHAEMKIYEDDCKEVEAPIKEILKDYKEKIKAYEDEHFGKFNTIYEAIVKPDEKEEFEAFCEEHEITIKEKK